ncbi:hypothetical protein ACHAXR_010093 [Thalassiosira sp. AJA248-18]
MNDDVTRVKTAKICAQRWDALFMARGSRKNTVNYSSFTTTESNNSQDDVFDCSDLIIPPTHDLINQEVARGIERWKDLASRVIVEEDGPTTTTTTDKTTFDGEGSADEDATVPLRNHELLLDAAVRGDKRKQRLLPYKFDYACKKKPSDDNGSVVANEDSSGGVVHHRPKVISLLDPTQTMDYDKELWRVFNSVKTQDELERIHALGNTTKNVGDDDSADDESPRDVPRHHGCQHTLGVKNNLKEWFAKYSRLDAHSLGRLRVRERHSDPVGGIVELPSSSAMTVKVMGADGGSNHKEVDDTSDQSATLQSTIRFEILRHSQNLKRGSGPDNNRMEVELHVSQHTLFDLHRLLVECSLNTHSCTKEEGGDDDDNIRAGAFFIENTFYTCGEVGGKVGEAIQHWLDGKEPVSMKETSKIDEESLPTNEAKLEASLTPRRQFLGLSSHRNLIHMSKMKLEDLPLRLGVRYFHMFVPPPTPLHLRPNNLWSLANESAVYATGIHTHSRKEGNQPIPTKAPIIIHDTWAPPQRHVCLACNHSLASVVSVNDPLTDAAPPGLDAESNHVHLQGVPMCSSCYQVLHYQPSNQQGLLELRLSHRPSLVFPIEDYQRMVAVSSLDGVDKSLAF